VSRYKNTHECNLVRCVTNSVKQNTPLSKIMSLLTRIKSYFVNYANKELLNFDELKDWQRDNEFIRSSYRPATLNLLVSIKSMFSIHCETCNIWSHLIGA